MAGVTQKCLFSLQSLQKMRKENESLRCGKKPIRSNSKGKVFKKIERDMI